MGAYLEVSMKVRLLLISLFVVIVSLAIVTAQTIQAWGLKGVALRWRFIIAGVPDYSVDVDDGGMFSVIITDWRPNGAVSNFSILGGMPIKSLIVNGTAAKDLTALHDLPLRGLWMSNTNITDIHPLVGLNLSTLDILNTAVSDVSPLAGMSLVNFGFSPSQITNGINVIRNMKSLSSVWYGQAKQARGDAKQFWDLYDMGYFRHRDRDIWVSP